MHFSVLNLRTEKGERESLIFSRDGCYLLGMLARSKRARAFRQWVLERLREDPRRIEELSRQVEALQRMNAALRRELLAARPLWRRIYQLKQMHGPLGERLSHREISRALRRAPSTLRKHIRRMEAIGLLEPAPDYERQRRMAAHLPLFRNLDNLH